MVTGERCSTQRGDPKLPYLGEFFWKIADFDLFRRKLKKKVINRVFFWLCLVYFQFYRLPTSKMFRRAKIKNMYWPGVFCCMKMRVTDFRGVWNPLTPSFRISPAYIYGRVNQKPSPAQQNLMAIFVGCYHEVDKIWADDRSASDGWPWACEKKNYQNCMILCTFYLYTQCWG